jgi:hypothetical protein
MLPPLSGFFGKGYSLSEPIVSLTSFITPSNIMERKRCQGKKRSPKKYFEIS